MIIGFSINGKVINLDQTLESAGLNNHKVTYSLTCLDATFCSKKDKASSERNSVFEQLWNTGNIYAEIPMPGYQVQDDPEAPQDASKFRGW
jgi:hypothetical protein